MSQSPIAHQDASPKSSYVRVKLPRPRMEGSVSVEKALSGRRSVREFNEVEATTMTEVSQLLWAAQGITSADGFRTSPSAGATYPLEVYLVAGNIRDLPPGIYHYDPVGHDLQLISGGDKRKHLAQVSLEQEAVADAPMVIALSAILERTTTKYGVRGVRYVHFEAGHVAQNISLQAVALGLVCVSVAAFHDEEVKRVLGLKEAEEALYLIPVGRR